MTNKHKCVERTKRSNITLKESGRKVNFRNPNNSVFDLVRVDNCVVTDGVRADWIVRKLDSGSVILELKGKDVPHACNQIIATFKNELCREWLSDRVAFLIVCSRFPSFDTTVQKMQENARKLGVRLKTICGSADVDFDSLF